MISTMGGVWWRPEPCRCLISHLLGVDDFLAVLLLFCFFSSRFRFLTLRKWSPLSLPPVGKHLADKTGLKKTLFVVNCFQ